jgi:hypothetical protein
VTSQTRVNSFPSGASVAEESARFARDADVGRGGLSWGERGRTYHVIRPGFNDVRQASTMTTFEAQANANPPRDWWGSEGMQTPVARAPNTPR